MFCNCCGNQNKDGALFCVFCGSQIPKAKSKKSGISDKTKTGLLITLGTLTLFVAVLFVMVIISLTKGSDTKPGSGATDIEEAKKNIETCIGDCKYSEAYDLIMQTEGLDEETKKAYLDTVYYDSLVATNSSKPKKSGTITDEYTLESAEYYPSTMQSDGVVLNGDAKHPVLKYTYKNGNGEVKTIYMVYDGKDYKEVTEEEAIAIANNSGYEMTSTDSVKRYYDGVQSGETTEIDEPVGDLPDPVPEDDNPVAEVSDDPAPTTEAEKPVATPDDAQPEVKPQKEETYYLVKKVSYYYETPDDSEEYDFSDPTKGHIFEYNYDFEKGEVEVEEGFGGNLMHPEYPRRGDSITSGWYFIPDEPLPFITRYVFKRDGKVVADEVLSFDENGKMTGIKPNDFGYSRQAQTNPITVKGQTVEWGDENWIITYDSKGRITLNRKMINDKEDEYKVEYLYDSKGRLKEMDYKDQNASTEEKAFWNQKSGDESLREWSFVSISDGKEDRTDKMTYKYDSNGCCIELINDQVEGLVRYEYIKVTVAPDGTISVSE